MGMNLNPKIYEAVQLWDDHIYEWGGNLQFQTHVSTKMPGK